MSIKSILFNALFLALSFSATAQCGSSSNHHSDSKAVKTSWSDANDIIDVAVGSDDFKTLVAAVKAADLVETLQGDGPFTVFAPSNAAFAKLPKGTIKSLLKKENKGTLSKILTYHVVAGEFKAADVVKAIKHSHDGVFPVKTVSGGTLKASLQNGTVILEDENGGISAVTQTDVDASNGVIHVIDSVVLPKG